MRTIKDLARLLFVTGGYFAQAMAFMVIGVLLLWLIGFIWPYIADAWGFPEKKPYDGIVRVVAEIRRWFGPTPTPAPAPPAPPEPKPAAVDPPNWEQTQAELAKVWEKDWDQAALLLEGFLARNPNHAAAKEKLNAVLISDGDRLVRNGDKEAAVSRYQRAAALGTSDGTARARLNALTPTPRPVAVVPSTATPIPPSPTPRPQPTPTSPPKPQSGRLGEANMSGWCRQAHNGTLYHADRGFDGSAGWYCESGGRNIPVNFNDVCQRAYGNPRAVGRYLNNSFTPYVVDCSVP